MNGALLVAWFYYYYYHAAILTAIFRFGLVNLLSG